MSQTNRDEYLKYQQQYYQQNKERLNAKRTENKNKQKDREDEEFMVMWMNTLDEQLADVRDRISKLDENDPEYDTLLKQAMAWAQVLMKAKEGRDGIDLSGFFQNIPNNLKIYNK